MKYSNRHENVKTHFFLQEQQVSSINNVINMKCARHSYNTNNIKINKTRFLMVGCIQLTLY